MFAVKGPIVEAFLSSWVFIRLSKAQQTRDSNALVVREGRLDMGQGFGLVGVFPSRVSTHLCHIVVSMLADLEP